MTRSSGELAPSKSMASYQHTASPGRFGDWLRRVRDFDLYQALDERSAKLVGVERGARLRDKAKALVGDPKKLAIMVAVVATFTGIVAFLFISGALGNVYEAIWTAWPGRPWTHAMRDNPWIYGALAVSLVWLPYTLSPPTRWGRAFVAYVVFWVGFLGGHVFW